MIPQASFVEKIIRRSNRNLLIISVVVLVILIGLEALSARYFINFFSGPTDISSEALLKVENPESLQSYYVNVEGDMGLDTGYQYVTEDNSGNVKSVDYSYAALLLDEKFLLVKVGGELPEKIGDQFTGALLPIPGDVQREVIDDMVRDEPDLDGSFLPYMLDATDFRTPGYIGLGIAALALIFVLWGLSSAVIRGADITKHPIMRSLARFGDPKTIADQIDMEMATATKAGNVHLTRRWVVSAGNASLDATRFEDVVWIYKKVTQHRTNGIPTGKTYTALMYDRHGKCITVNGKENVVNEMLAAVAAQAPWAFMGYDAQIDQAWRKDRQGFIGTVDQRRRQAVAA